MLSLFLSSCMVAFILLAAGYVVFMLGFCAGRRHQTFARAVGHRYRLSGAMLKQAPTWARKATAEDPRRRTTICEDYAQHAKHRAAVDAVAGLGRAVLYRVTGPDEAGLLVDEGGIIPPTMRLTIAAENLRELEEGGHICGEHSADDIMAKDLAELWQHPSLVELAGCP